MVGFNESKILTRVTALERIIQYVLLHHFTRGTYIFLQIHILSLWKRHEYHAGHFNPLSRARRSVRTRASVGNTSARATV